VRTNDTGLRALAALTVAVMVVVVGTTEATRAEWESYTFRASSALPPFAVAGRLAETGPWELVLQTKVELDPWVEIDLMRERVVTRLVLVPGALRVYAAVTAVRGQPHTRVVELAGEDRIFREVARVEQERLGTERWEVALGERRARYARVRVIGWSVLFFQTLELE
jgi:hypothetical protein